MHTDERGQFEFVGLVPGNYSLETGRRGFQTALEQLQLASGQVLRRDISIKVGTVEEFITVVSGLDTHAPARPSGGAASATAACSAEPNSGRLTPPRKIVDVRPAYPASMAGTQTDSRVVMWARIGIDGAVKQLRTIEAASPAFEESAQEAVRQWRFTETLLNCVPIEVEMKVSTLFRPQGAAPPPPPSPLPPAAPAPPAR